MKKYLFKIFLLLLKKINNNNYLSKYIFSSKNKLTLYVFKKNIDLYLLVLSWQIQTRKYKLVHKLLSDRRFNNSISDIDLRGALLILDRKLVNYCDDSCSFPIFRNDKSFEKFIRLLIRGRLNDYAYKVSLANHKLNNKIINKLVNSLKYDSLKIDFSNSHFPNKSAEKYLESLFNNNLFFTFVYFICKNNLYEKLNDNLVIKYDISLRKLGHVDASSFSNSYSTKILDISGEKEQYKLLIKIISEIRQDSNIFYKIYVDDFIRTPLPNIPVPFEVINKNFL